MSNANIHLGPFVLDFANAMLRHGEQEVPLRRKTLDVLMVLARAAGKLVSRREILDTVWKGVAIQDETLNSSISEIRRALGDPRSQARYLQTVHGRGFRLLTDEALAASNAAAGPPASQPLIGRSTEIERFERALHYAVAGRMRVIELCGEAGMGKSRLTAEIAARARDRGALVLTAKAQDASQYSSFWIWSQILRSCAAQVDPDTLRQALGTTAADIIAFVPSLARRFGEDEPRLPVYEPGIGRLRFFDAVTAMLEQLSGAATLVLVFEDLHSASDSSLALLQAVAESLFNQRILVVVNFRPAEGAANPHLVRLSERWRRYDWVERIDLGPLPVAVAEELVRAAAAGIVSPELTRRIATGTGGNPYFIIEVARSLASRAETDAGSGSYQVPDGVRSVLAERIALLSPGARKLLEAAAVGGTALDVRVATDAAGIPAAEALPLITELVRREVLIDDLERPTDVRFGHDLYRETILASLSAPEKANLHLRFGEALERLEQGQPANRTQLAYHFIHAGSFDRAAKAVVYGLEAAAETMGYYANSEADTMLEQCRQRCDSDGSVRPEIRARLYQLLTETRVRLGRFDDVEAFAECLGDLGREHEQPEWLAGAAMALSRGAFPFRPPDTSDRAITLLDEALAALGSGNARTRARVTAHLAMSLLARDDQPRRIALARCAQQEALATDDMDERAHLLFRVLAGLWDPDHAAQRLAACEQFSLAAQAARESYFRHQALLMRATTLLSLGRIRDFRRTLVEHREYQQAQPVETIRRYLHRSEVIDAALAGDMARVHTLARGFATLPPHPYPFVGMLEAFFAQFTEHLELGTLDQLLPLVEGLAAQFPSLPFALVVPRLRLDAGDLQAARHALEQMAARGFPELPPRNEAYGWLPLVCSLGTTAAHVADRRSAAHLYELLLPYRDLWATVQLGLAVLGSVRCILGELAAAVGRVEAAIEHFDATIVHCEAEEAWTEMARAQLGLARALEQAHRQPERARELRQQALDFAESHDLDGLCRLAAR